MANEERKEEGPACGCGGGSCCTGPGKWIWIVLAVAVVGVLIARNAGKKPAAPTNPGNTPVAAIPRLVDLGDDAGQPERHGHQEFPESRPPELVPC